MALPLLRLMGRERTANALLAQIIANPAGSVPSTRKLPHSGSCKALVAEQALFNELLSDLLDCVGVKITLSETLCQLGLELR